MKDVVCLQCVLQMKLVVEFVTKSKSLVEYLQKVDGFPDTGIHFIVATACMAIDTAKLSKSKPAGVFIGIYQAICSQQTSHQATFAVKYHHSSCFSRIVLSS